MARVTIGTKRPQASNTGIYSQSLKSGDVITCRRKILTPADVIHPGSKATALQRQRFTRAVQRYSQLPRPNKQRLKNEYQFISYQPPHGRSDTKLLSGKSLAISLDIHDLATKGTVHPIPTDLCMIVTDAAGDPLEVKRIFLSSSWLHGFIAYFEHLGNANYLLEAVNTTATSYVITTNLSGWWPSSRGFTSFIRLELHQYIQLRPSFWIWMFIGGQQLNQSYNDNWQYISGHRRANGLLYKITPLPPLDGNPYHQQPPYFINFKETKIDEWTLTLIAPNYLQSPVPSSSAAGPKNTIFFDSIPDYGPMNPWVFWRSLELSGNPWVYWPTQQQQVIGHSAY